jgi:hypothetical protein
VLELTLGLAVVVAGADCFGCGHCHDLTYTSCQESHQLDGLFRIMASNIGWDFDTVKRAMNSIGKRK